MAQIPTSGEGGPWCGDARGCAAGAQRGRMGAVDLLLGCFTKVFVQLDHGGSEFGERRASMRDNRAHGVIATQLCAVADRRA